MSYRAYKQVIDTHTLTDTQTGAMTIPEGQNWPRVMKQNKNMYTQQTQGTAYPIVQQPGASKSVSQASGSKHIFYSSKLYIICLKKCHNLLLEEWRVKFNQGPSSCLPSSNEFSSNSSVYPSSQINHWKISDCSSHGGRHPRIKELIVLDGRHPRIKELILFDV